MTSKKVPLAEPVIPITISSTFCGYSVNDDVNHVLRCGYSTDVPSSCNRTTDIVLCCTKFLLWKYPYEMEVRLNNKGGDVFSSGSLEIYHNNVSKLLQWHMLILHVAKWGTLVHPATLPAKRQPTQCG